MGSNRQLPNPLPEDFIQFLKYTVSSQNGGSPMWRNFSQPAVEVPRQDAPYIISQQSYPANSRASIEGSSVITFANSSFSGDPNLSSNGDNSTESFPSNYGRIQCPSNRDHPAQQQTFFGRISCPSTNDPFAAQQQTFHEGQTYPGFSARQGVQLSNLPLGPQLINPAHQASVPLNFKRPRLEMDQIDTAHPYSLQQPSPNQVPIQLNNSAAAAMLHQQHVIRNQLQNQNPFAAPPTERCNMQRLPPPQLTADTHEALAGLNSTNAKSCYRRLMSYMDHHNHGPPENNIEHWKKFVDIYFYPAARKRWCMSKYSDIGNLADGLFTQANLDTWTCDFCGSRLEKGFEASYKVLPWLCQKNFEGGLIEELLYVESPVEKLLPSGFMVLWFKKAIQESVYAHTRVVHEGQLRIIFTSELKIICWEFCIQGHEDFIARRAIANQVNELVEYATKCSEENAEGVMTQHQLSNIATAGSIIARNVKLSGVNQLGFSLPFARILQVSDVLTSMKDLMADMSTYNISPIEALNRYKSQQEAANANSRQMQTASTADSNFQQTSDIVSETPCASANANANADAGEQQAVAMLDPYYLKQKAMTTQAVPMIDPYYLKQQAMTNQAVPRIDPYYLKQQAMTNQGVPRIDPYYLMSTQAVPMLDPYYLNQQALATQAISGTSSSRQLPSIDRQINDVLACMHAEGASPGCRSTRNTRAGKSRLAHDPSSENPKRSGQVDKAKGKLLKNSSVSNSSAKIPAGSGMIKREPESDDDSISHGQYQGLNETCNGFAQFS